ncbi:MAG: DUF2382 domain-containing protein [Chloroflexota bacterium]
MSKTVLALYDDFETARSAVEALVDAGFERSHISVVANDASEKYAGSIQNTDDGDVKSGEGAGFGAVVGGLIGLGVALIPGVGPVLAAGPLAALVFGGIGAAAGAATGGIVAGLVDLGMDQDEAEHYAEGIRRGGALVSVDLDADEHVERAESILNRYNPVNIDERGETYRSSGWTGFDANAQPYNESQINDLRSSTNLPAAGTTSSTVRPGEQQKLEVVEEQLNVGKREVEGDTVRVHTRVTERPVQQQVNLREERVVVERRPVDRAANPADVNAFQEATIEIQERHEEAVVEKIARVVEEVVVGKQASERVETVQDTVRRKDVEIEGAAGSRSYADYETRFRNAYNTNFASSGTWEEYSPAYRFGYDLSNDNRYKDYTWDRVQSNARTQWEQQHPNTWEQFKDAVRDAWGEITGRR